MINFIYPYGSTALDPNEIEGLIPNFILTQSELNEQEQQNILEAEKWAFSRKRLNILSVEYIKQLHRKMFGQTWKWAGQFRRTNKNIGVDWPVIAVELLHLIQDVTYQIEKQIYNYHEIGARFHHKLVWIHCFPNGNGRHARLMTDILLVSLGKKRFNWGSYNDNTPQEIRREYIKALREADRYDYTRLIKFIGPDK